MVGSRVARFTGVAHPSEREGQNRRERERVPSHSDWGKQGCMV